MTESSQKNILMTFNNLADWIIKNVTTWTQHVLQMLNTFE